MNARLGPLAMRIIALGAIAGLWLGLWLALAPSRAQARSCDPVVNPYEGTRYEGVDLRRIRAEGVQCPKARRVTRRAHKKALGLVPDSRGFLRFRWSVVGDLRPSSDRYVAKRRDKRVRWRF